LELLDGSSSSAEEWALRYFLYLRFRRSLSVDFSFLGGGMGGYDVKPEPGNNSLIGATGPSDISIVPLRI
jgi:hypothetical protein